MLSPAGGSRAHVAAAVAVAGVACAVTAGAAAAEEPANTSSSGSGSGGGFFSRFRGSSTSSTSSSSSAGGPPHSSSTPSSSSFSGSVPLPGRGGAAAGGVGGGSSLGGGGAAFRGHGTPLSGAIPALDEQGRTNNPLDYNPITNEHTAAMTLAKQSGLEAFQRGRYKEAEKLFLEALEQAKLGFPADDLHIPSAMNLLAELYRATHQWGRAEELYKQAISHLVDAVGDKHWMVAGAHSNLGLLYEQQGRYKEAQKELQHTLELKRALFSSHSFPYADTASTLARVMLEAGGQTPGAIKLYADAIKIVEDSGSPEDTPVLLWLVAMADAQSSIKQPAAAAATLRRALQIMIQIETSAEASAAAQRTQRAGTQEQEAQDAAAREAAGGEQTGPAAESPRARLLAEASEINEKLGDALAAAGDLPAAREALQACLEARMQLFREHLIVAKTMVHFAQLLLTPPPAPDAVQQALYLGAAAKKIAGHALLESSKGTAWQRLTWQTGPSLERATHKLQASLQLAKAHQTLAAAHQLAGSGAQQVAALRKGLQVLRAGQATGQRDIAALGDTLPEEGMDRLVGLLVDVKLLQLDMLEALAAALQQQLDGRQQPTPAAAPAAAAAPASQEPSTGNGFGGWFRRSGSSSSSQDQPAAAAVQQEAPAAAAAGGASPAAEEIRMLLVEAETLAGELYGVN